MADSAPAPSVERATKRPREAGDEGRAPEAPTAIAPKRLRLEQGSGRDVVTQERDERPDAAAAAGDAPAEEARLLAGQDEGLGLEASRAEAAAAAPDRFGPSFAAQGRDEHPEVAVLRACEIARVRLRAAEAVEDLLRTAGKGRRPSVSRTGRLRHIDTRRTKSGRAAAQQGVAMGMQGMLARSQLSQMLEERAACGAGRQPADPLLPSPSQPDLMLAKEVKKLVDGLDRDEAWGVASSVAGWFREAAARVKAAADRLADDVADAQSRVEWVWPAPEPRDGSPVGGGSEWGLLRFQPAQGSDAASLLRECSAMDGKWVLSAARSAAMGSQFKSVLAGRRVRSGGSGGSGGSGDSSDGLEELARQVTRLNPCVGFG